MKNNRKISSFLMLVCLLVVVLAAAPLVGRVSAAPLLQDPTVSPEPTTAPPPSGSFVRPVIILNTYSTGDVESVTPNQDVNLILRLHNAGQSMAFNVVVNVTPGDFVTRNTGGVLAVEEIDPGETLRVNQPLTATWDIVGKTFATVVASVSYTDQDGIGYSETFTLSIPVTSWSGGPTRTPTPTATLAASLRPQMVITGYDTDIDQLQPGFQFHLNLQLNNVGNSPAKRVTMILGGGSGSSVGPDGTPIPGGVSGGGGDFGNFAPVASSNVQFLGDLAPGASLNPSANLIVNASTNPGAYPMKISFTYTNEGGITFTDDQVITLLVFAPPLLEVNFYTDPGVFFAGQPGPLPLQVVNLGRSSTVLGNMTVTAENAELTNGTTLVGPLETGGYFTLDAMLIPFEPGPLDLNVTINYTDDFNQPQQIQKTVTVEVMEAPVIEPMPEEGTPGAGGEMPFPEEPATETIWQKIGRFFRGLFGLDSGQEQPGEVFPEEMPMEEMPIEGGGVINGPKG